MPKQWPQVALGEILTERNETPDPALVRAGDIPIISKIRFSDGGIELRTDSDTNTKMILIHPGDLVLSGINAMKGAIAIYDPGSSQKVAATIHYAAYQVNKEKADIRYLWWLLRSQYFQDILSQQVPQGIKTELKAKRLLPVVIPLPSLTEQMEIVLAIQNFSLKIHGALQLQKAAIQENGQVVGSMTVSLMKSYSNVSKVALKELILDIRYGTSRKADSDPTGVPVIRMGNIQNGTITFEDLKYLKEPSTSESNSFTLQKGDILVNRTNSADLVGKSAVFEGNGTFFYASYIIRLRPDFSKINPHFLNYYINSPIGREFMLANKSQLIGQANINSKKLLALEIPVPDLDKQEDCVRQLRTLSLLQTNISTFQKSCLNELDALLPSIVSKIFQGEI